MNKLTRLTALLLAMLMIFSTVATAETAYQAGGMTIDNWQSIVDSAEDKLFTIDEGDSGKVVTPPPAVTPVPGEFYPYSDGTTTALAVNAQDVTTQMTAFGVAVLQNAEAGQWQMRIDDEWVGITGAKGSEMWVTAAMMNGMSEADFRKALEPTDKETGAYTIFTNTVTVEIVAEVSGTMFMMARDGEAEVTPEPTPVVAANDVMTVEEANADNTVAIEVAYWIDNRDISAARSWTGTNPKNGALNSVVALPIVPGFIATRIDIKLGTNTVDHLDGITFVSQTQATDLSIVNGSIAFNIESLPEDLSIVVHYAPAAVKFRVDHYLQNLDNDNYTLIQSTQRVGQTDSVVGEGLQLDDYTKNGYVSLLYDTQTVVAADGSTYVEIYYDRLYYLLSFKLGGGQGFDPVYDKFGAPISYAKPPTRDGYEFVGWTKDENHTNTNAADYDPRTLITVDEMPTTVPAQNQIYYAVWKPVETIYSVVYLFENANSTDVNNPDNYSVVHIERGVLANHYLTAVTETEVTRAAQANIETAMTQAELNALEEKLTHFERYDGVGGQSTYVVQGDGTTQVRVYYTRKSYSIRFYYMRSTTNNTQYEIPSDYGHSESSARLSGAVWNRTEYPEPVELKPEFAGITKGHSDLSLSGNTTRRYHYIEITAKYNSDLTAIWPALPFEDYHSYRQNSWAIHGDTPYYDTIVDTYTFKGIYKKLDDNLITTSTNDPVFTGNPNLATYFVSYWNNPSQQEYFLYNIYLAIPSEDVQFLPDNAVTITRNRVTYLRVDTNLALSGSGFDGQNDPAYEGMTYIRGSKESAGSGSGTDTNPIPINFRYNPIQYHLIYMSNGETARDIMVPYQAMLRHDTYAKYVPDNGPAYHVFDGWYADETFEGEPFDFTTAKMPAKNVMLYAKWTPKTYTVTVYDNQELATTPGAEDLYFFKSIEHGKATSSAYTFDNPDHFDQETGAFKEPQPPTDQGNWEFVGWFYFDENGEEAAFSFHDTPITRNTIAYAKWRSNALMPYTIRYAIKGANGEDIYIAADTTGSSLAGNTLTFEAKVGDQLFADYQTGYYPEVGSHSLTLDIDGTAENKLNEYTFYYKKVAGIPYKVRYVDKATGEELPDVPEKFVRDNTDAIVTESFVEVAGMQPDAFQKKLVLSATGTDADNDGIWDENVITFYYSESENGMVVRTHYIESIAGGTYTEYSSSTDYNGVFGQTYTIEQITIPGFEVNLEHADNVQEGTLVEDQVTYLHLKLHYDRIDYPYVFKFVDIATGEEIATAVTGTAPYQSNVSENALEIPGYTKTATTPESFTMPIYIENPKDVAKNNVYIFYYEQEQVTINYVAVPPDGGTVIPSMETIGASTGVPEGSVATPATNYEFAGWYLDKDCTQPVDSSWVNGATIKPTKNEDAVWVDGTTYYAKFKLAVADLTIKKTVIGASDGTVAPAEEFAVKVQLTNADGTVAVGPYTYTSNMLDRGGILVLTNGEGTLPIVDGEEIVIKGIVIGTQYEVVEADLPYYTEVVDQKGQTAIAAPNGNNNVVEITNTYLTGSLTIKKVVEGATAPDTDEFTFTLALSNKHQKYTYTKGTTTGEVAYNGELKLKKGESVTIAGIPLGTDYTVAETADPDYTTNPADGKFTGKITETSTVTFTNTYQRGDLRIGKRVEPAGVSAGEEFRFALTLTNAQGAPLTGTYAYSIVNLLSSTTVDGNIVEVYSEPAGSRTLTLNTEGVYTFELAATEHIVIKDLPAGTNVKIAETPVEGYVTFVSINNEVPTEGGKTTVWDKVDIVAGTEQKIRFINYQYEGTLNIVKVVQGNAAPAGKKFSFNIELKDRDGNPLSETVRYEVRTFNENGQEVKTEGNTADGVLNVELSHRESVYIYNLPTDGKFVVSELLDSDYTTTHEEHYNETEQESAMLLPETDYYTVSRSLQEVNQVTFYNTYNYGTLTIEKKGMEAGETAIFKAVGNDGSSYTVAITMGNDGSGSATIGHLPLNTTFMVTELTDWSWRYTSTPDSASVTIDLDGETVSFKNEKTNNKWLSDESSIVNFDGSDK